MIELEKNFDSSKYETELYSKWKASNAFQADPTSNKKRFSIMMPPPNATGVLHLGHVSVDTVQDIMIRVKRMQGYDVLWLPGTDHAAIATQSVVEKNLQKRGIKNPRQELGREKLLSEIKEFVEGSKNTIRSQVAAIGSSCDWSREKYTLDDSLNHAVNSFFGRMYADGLIYHGDRIVNWDPKMQTTVADDEMEYKEEKTKFYYFKFGPVVISTARPETKFLDKVIVVHPEDERYKDLVGKEVDVEWINGPIKAKVIADKCIDPALGTGAMTITPAHSQIDFELAEQHKLERPQIIDYSGKLKECAGEFAGMDCVEARPLIVKKLEEKGLLVKVDENYIHNVAVNYRGKGVIEPQIMKQWFVDVNKRAIDWKGKKMSLKEIMQHVISTKMIRINPERFEKIYFGWIDNLRDWCISRQIWWGHQIPVWYRVSSEDKAKWQKYPESSSYLLQSLNIKIEETKYSETEPEEGIWIRDPDTLDTWFSSAMWTFSTLDWPAHTEEFLKYHPTNLMVTAYDILFFWVARMILASVYCLRKDGLSEEMSIPFKDVYLCGLIRDINGKKMSKSHPETCIDPMETVNKYGADALRISIIMGNTPGNDMRIYDEKIASARNFINKIWNASRFALMNVEKANIEIDIKNAIKSPLDKWIVSELNKTIKNVNENLEKYRFSDVITELYEFTWSIFCDWYLEFSKGDQKNEQVLLYVLRKILTLLHPYIPFVTEVIWAKMGFENIMDTEKWPEYDPSLSYEKEESVINRVKDVISSVRATRAEFSIEPAKLIAVTLQSDDHIDTLKDYQEIMKKMMRASEIHFHQAKTTVSKAVWKYANDVNIYLPIGDLIDIEKEKENVSKKIKNLDEKIHSIKTRIENPGFLAKAPKEIVEKERLIMLDIEKELGQLNQKISELDKL